MAAFNYALALLVSIAAIEAGAQRPTFEVWKEGQANNTAAAEDNAAREAKMVAVNKVVAMLEGLKSKVLAMGESEAATYNRFSCFCKDTTAEKSKAIEDGHASKDSLSAEIMASEATRASLDTDIATCSKDITDANQEMKSADFFRGKTQEEYSHNAADLKAALESLSGAIKALKASKTPSLMQIQSVGKTVRTAVLLANALGLGGKSMEKATSLFLQQAPEVEMKNYDFHSDDIIKTLEQLEIDFRATQLSVDEEEVHSVHEHQIFMQEKTSFVKAKTIALSEAQKEKAYTQEKIATTSQELSTVEALLLDDQQYLEELAQMCSEKAQTWDQRSSVRANELTTLTQVINVITTTVSNSTSAGTVRLAQQGVSVRLAEAIARNPAAMEAVEADAEEQEESEPTSQAFAFLQRSARSAGVQAHRGVAGSRPEANEDAGREAVVALLRNKGKDLKSTLLTSLANKIGEDPFAKIKKLIQELVDRLLTQAAEEQTHHAWCDKAMSDSKQKRGVAANNIERLNGEMAALEALRDKLIQELIDLNAEIADLKSRRATAEGIRAEEKAENSNTVNEASNGLTALDMAIDILWKFYATMDKETVEYSFAQQQRRAPGGDAPKTDFEIGEAYTGSQSEATGILGMMDVMKSDFMRTVAETEKAEMDAERAHMAFMTETGRSLAEKQTAASETLTYKDNAMSKLASADEDLQQRIALLQASLQELLDLKAVCIDTGMSYGERVANREEEIDALKKALCILDSYAKYGPGGAGDC
jgi:hypothetical protein